MSTLLRLFKKAYVWPAYSLDPEPEIGGFGLLPILGLVHLHAPHQRHGTTSSTPRMALFL